MGIKLAASYFPSSPEEGQHWLKDLGVISHYVGRCVRKHFREHGWHEGVVSSADFETATGLVLLRVHYKDGDEEDLYAHEYNQVRDAYRTHLLHF